MSSESRKISAKNDLLVIGNPWTAPVVAERFLAHGRPPTVVTLPFFHPSWPRSIVVTLGNGEREPIARRIFGDAVAAKLWEASEANFSRATRLPGVSMGELEWHGEGGGILREPAALLHLPSLIQGLGDSTEEMDTLVSVEKIEPMGYLFHLRQRGKPVEISTTVAVIATERLAKGIFPWVDEKWIPVTLGSFTYPAKKQVPTKALFHGGVDFAVGLGDKVRLGSYRNLFEDKAVGFHDQPDPATLNGIRNFFGKLGWIEDALPLESHVSAEFLSCDGLPLVGALPDFPGVYLVGAFASRTQNFIFETADRLATGILHSGDFSGMSVFSTKRFV